jgi:sec-independent protein translocase protein TatC
LLFFLGMSFAYFIVFPTVFGFVNRFAPEGVAVMTDIDKYLSFVMQTFLAFGITFEVPVVVIVLVKVGLVSVAKLREIRPYVVVGAFVVGAVFTPPDVLSQFLLAMPLWLLYELGVVIASVLTRPSKETVKEPDTDAAKDAESRRIAAEMKEKFDRAEADSRQQPGE